MDERTLFSCFNVGFNDRGTCGTKPAIQDHSESFFHWLLHFRLCDYTNKLFPHGHQSSSCTVTCNMLLLLGARGSALICGLCSLTPQLQVITEALRSVSPLCSPLAHEWESPQTKHWLSSQQDPRCHQAIYPKHSLPPHPPAFLHTAQLSGKRCCIEASCIARPPLRSKA